MFRINVTTNERLTYKLQNNIINLAILTSYIYSSYYIATNGRYFQKSICCGKTSFHFETVTISRFFFLFHLILLISNTSLIYNNKVSEMFLKIVFSIFINDFFFIAISSILCNNIQYYIIWSILNFKTTFKVIYDVFFTVKT